ncbi:hypothetical protein BGX24_004133 [Mortierella sp. AD032]|nr:hypothetical protein BGX24_004133 [Mortierella sp. AD032]
MIRASQGDANAQAALGDRYKKGDGVDRDRQAALDWYLKAAEQGHAYARCNIGLLFCADISLERMVYYEQYLGDSAQDNHDSESEGDDDIPRDRAKGFEWLLKAAHQGLADAQLAVAIFMVLDGELDQANPEPTFLSTMFDWSRKAADQDHAMAQIFLAILYGEGLGVSKDEAEAFRLALNAVNRSGGFAECILGWWCRYGECIPQDDSTAFEWFVKGAEQGNTDCEYEVAKSYEKGKGIPADCEKAIEWYTKASENGHRRARDNFDRLTAKLEGLPVGDATDGFGGAERRCKNHGQ